MPLADQRFAAAHLLVDVDGEVEDLGGGLDRRCGGLPAFAVPVGEVGPIDHDVSVFAQAVANGPVDYGVGLLPLRGADSRLGEKTLCDVECVEVNDRRITLAVE